MKTKFLIVLLALLICLRGFAGEIKEIAITIDDLPFVGSAHSEAKNAERPYARFYSLLQALVDHQVPATGFVIAGSISKGQWVLLEEFRNQGFQLGNHSYSHQSLNSLNAEKYISDVDKADNILQKVLTSPKYFRYPYLAEATGARRARVQEFLAERDYIIAPVTVDSKDFRFNSKLLAIPRRLRAQNLERIKQQYLAYMWNQTVKAEARSYRKHPGVSRQILLIHANLLNSHFMGDIIDMYQENGYRIVSLDDIMNKNTSHDESFTSMESPS